MPKKKMSALKFKLLNDEAFPPQRAHPTDAGIDVFTPIDFTLQPGEDASIGIGVAFDIPEDEMLLVQTKSGIGTKRKCSTSAGATVIDACYRGECHVQIINFGKEAQSFKRGDKIAQFVEVPVRYSVLEETADLSETDRGAGWAGSTGEKHTK